jgi:hypothetical protein
MSCANGPGCSPGTMRIPAADVIVLLRGSVRQRPIPKQAPWAGKQVRAVAAVLARCPVSAARLFFTAGSECPRLLAGAIRLQRDVAGSADGRVMPAKIFVSYRREDVPGDARGIYDGLARAFGEANVFLDVDKLLAGQRFDQELDKALAQCDVLIVVIGARWMDLLATKTAAQERDYVCEEIAAALAREITVIPVLVGRDGHMPPLPKPAELPDGIRKMPGHQKHTVSHEHFGRDMAALIEQIGLVRGKEKKGGGWTHHQWRNWPRAALLLTAGCIVAAALYYLGSWIKETRDFAAFARVQEVIALVDKGTPPNAGYCRCALILLDDDGWLKLMQRERVPLQGKVARLFEQCFAGRSNDELAALISESALTPQGANTFAALMNKMLAAYDDFARAVASGYVPRSKVPAGFFEALAFNKTIVERLARLRNDNSFRSISSFDVKSAVPDCR